MATTRWTWPSLAQRPGLSLFSDPEANERGGRASRGKTQQHQPGVQRGYSSDLSPEEPMAIPENTRWKKGSVRVLEGFQIHQSPMYQLPVVSQVTQHSVA